MISARVKAKKKYRKLKRQVPEADAVSHLNITPMMDMMTILVVFFLKSFSVDVQNVTSEDIVLPQSSSQRKPESYLDVAITKKALLVEKQLVAAVKNGEVDSSVKENGANDLKIVPLFQALQKHAVRLKKLEKMTGKKFEGDMILVADQTTPYRLISEVLYTAGLAEFGRYRLMVLKRE